MAKENDELLPRCVIHKGNDCNPNTYGLIEVQCRELWRTIRDSSESFIDKESCIKTSETLYEYKCFDIYGESTWMTVEEFDNQDKYAFRAIGTKRERK